MSQPALYTIATLHQQIRSTVVRVLYHSFNDSQRQVVVRGNIGEITAGPYRMAYRVPLRDGFQTVYLDVERELLAHSSIEPGDYVEVTGVLTVDDGQSQSSRVDIRVAVSRIEHVHRPQEFERNERATVEFLKTLKSGYPQLPEVGSIFVSLIHSISEGARVQDDFQEQLGPVGYLVQQESIPVAMNKPEAIANGIQRANGNVIVLIRGGGDPADFDVFDQKPVIEAWAAKSACKLLGLGHEGIGNTLLYFISDYAASTPSAVRTFLAQRITEMNERKRMAEVLTQRCQTLDEEKHAAQFEVSRANDVWRQAQQQSIEAAKRDRDRMLVIAAFLLGIIFVIGFILGHRWAH